LNPPYELNGEVFPLQSTHTDDITAQYQELSADGFRVLAVAYKPLPQGELISKEDEYDLILKGYIAFLDPPKDSASKAISALQGMGVQVKVLTGDNEIVTRKICSLLGLDVKNILLGSMLDALNENELTQAVATTQIFARLTPEHKRRIIRTLQSMGHVVGFMGDGINDAPALHVADVGISVDSAVDIAKAAAPVILLEKDLMVLKSGVIEGRVAFVNILKYIRMGASSNFGNMLSILGASALLPFIPMTPIQILTNNLLYDVSQIPIPTDNVEAEFITKPCPWEIGGIKKFVLVFGCISSIFDYTTFWVMLNVFGCWDPSRSAIFQTGWFVQSLITQTLIIHIIRTPRIPGIKTWASWQLTLTSLGIMSIAIWLPNSPLAKVFGFTGLPLGYWPILLATLVGYVLLTQTAKKMV
jgi:Mg2+-importing ATPase